MGICTGINGRFYWTVDVSSSDVNTEMSIWSYGLNIMSNEMCKFKVIQIITILPVKNVIRKKYQVHPLLNHDSI